MKKKKRKDGRYSVQVYLGVHDGKRKCKTVYGKAPSGVNAKANDLRVKLGKEINILAADEG